MEKEKGYNGWENWETWNLILWTSNDEELYSAVKGRRKACGEYNAESAEYSAKGIVGPMGTPDMKGYADYMAVNWDEVAEAWNEY